jgi:hypothetical protein
MMLKNCFSTTIRRHFAHQWFARCLQGLLVVALAGALDPSNEARAALIGIDFGGPTVPTNWNSGTAGPNPQTLLNLIDEDGSPTGIDLSYNGAFQADVNLSASYAPNAVQIPAHTQSLAGIDGSVTDFEAIIFEFSGLVPKLDYFVWVFGGDRTLRDSSDVTIIGDGPPIIFPQTFSHTDPGELWVNNMLGSNMPLPIFAVTATATSSGQLSIEVVPHVPGTILTDGGVNIAAIAIEASEEAPIPEPGAAWLISLGMMMVGLAVRWRHRMLP